MLLLAGDEPASSSRLASAPHRSPPGRVQLPFLGSNDAKHKRTWTIEVPTDYTFRWLKTDTTERIGRIVGDQTASAGFTPFVDRVDKDPSKDRGTSKGVELRVGYKSDVPKPTWLKEWVPATLEWQSRYVGEIGGHSRHDGEHTVTARWSLWDTASRKQGLKLQRDVGGNFRTGESKAPKTTLSMTLAYGP